MIANCLQDIVFHGHNRQQRWIAPILRVKRKGMSETPRALHQAPAANAKGPPTAENIKVEAVNGMSGDIGR